MELKHKTLLVLEEIKHDIAVKALKEKFLSEEFKKWANSPINEADILEFGL